MSIEADGIANAHLSQYAAVLGIGGRSRGDCCAGSRSRHRHHRVVHEHGYRVDRMEDGALRFFRADGAPLPEADTRPSPLPLDAFERLRDLHSEQGLAIDATTAFPRWDGEPADYGLIVEGLVHHQRVG